MPASLWFDRDAAPLRRLLLDRCCGLQLDGAEVACENMELIESWASESNCEL